MRIVIVFLLSLGVSLAIAQPDTILITHPIEANIDLLSPNNGLSDKTVFSIYQDRQGFMWIATLNGLNRYDGYEIKNYFHQPEDTTSLNENYVRSILEDREGTLWVGTWGGGVNRYLPELDGFRHYRTAHATLNSDSVAVLFEDHRHQLWAGTIGGGLNRYLPKEDRFAPVPNTTHLFRSVRAIQEDSAGCLWLATERGLYCYEPSRQAFTRFYHIPNQPNSLSGNNLLTLLIDHRNYLWIGTTNNGLNRLDLQSYRIVRYSTSDSQVVPGVGIRALYEDRQRNVWIGTTQGLFRYDPSYDRFSLISPLDKEMIQAMYQSRDESLWMGTFHSGIYRINRQRQFSYRTKSEQGLNDRNVSALAADSMGQVYVGTTHGGVNIFDRTTGRWTHLTQAEGLSSDHIISLACDGRGVLWIGTRKHGLNLFDPKSRRILRYPELPTDFYEATSFNLLFHRDTCVWLVTSHQVYRYDESTHALRRILNLPSDAEEHQLISTLFVDHQQNAWIGTRSGLYQATYPSYTLEEYPLVEDQSPYVTAIQEDKNNRLWIGTARGNLYRIDAEQNCSQLAFRQKGSIVSGIMEDATGTLWVGSSRGIAKLDATEEQDSPVAALTVYDRRTALPSDYVNVNAFCRSDRTFWWGTNDGLIYFDPLRQPARQAPPLVLTDFRVANQDTTATQSLQAAAHRQLVQLPPAHNSFTATFAALRYANPGHTQYTFFLEGYDSVWHTTKAQRSVAYHDLDPGFYTLKVRASDVDRRWTSYQTVKIRVLPSPWKTPVAYCIYAGLLLVSLTAAYRYRQPPPTESEAVVTDEHKTPKPPIVREDAFLHEAYRLMELHLTDPSFSTEDFAREVGLSRTHLYLKVKQSSGLTVREFIKEYRLKKAAEILSQEDKTVAEVAYLVGFSSYRYFSKCFKEKFGQSPSKFCPSL